jgi:hypothetical protein
MKGATETMKDVPHVAGCQPLKGVRCLRHFRESFRHIHLAKIVCAELIFPSCLWPRREDDSKKYVVSIYLLDGSVL